MQERFAATFGLLAFLVTVIGALARQSPFADTMLYALVALVVFTVIGWGLGRIGALLVGEHIQQHEPPAPLAAPSAAQQAGASADRAEAASDQPEPSATGAASGAGAAKR